MKKDMKLQLSVTGDLHEAVKGIADRYMMSQSTLCGMFVREGVEGYRNQEQQTDITAEQS